MAILSFYRKKPAFKETSEIGTGIGDVKRGATMQKAGFAGHKDVSGMMCVFQPAGSGRLPVCFSAGIVCLRRL